MSATPTVPHSAAPFFLWRSANTVVIMSRLERPESTNSVSTQTATSTEVQCQPHTHVLTVSAVVETVTETVAVAVAPSPLAQACVEAREKYIAAVQAMVFANSAYIRAVEELRESEQ